MLLGAVMINLPETVRSEEERLPFDPRTVALGLWRRRWTLLAIAVGSAAIGAAAGLLLGSTRYEATAVLAYEPLTGAARVQNLQAGLHTEASRVRTPAVLEEARARAGLDAPIERLAAAVEARASREGAVLSIEASWDDPEVASSLANGVRDAFLSTWVRDQAGRLQGLQDRASADLEAIDRRLDRLSTAIEEMKSEVEREQAKVPEENMGTLMFRYQQVREAIQSDVERRANLALMAQRRLELERARTLRAKDLISQAEFEAAVAAFERQKALTVDTPEIAGFRRQLARLASSIESASTATLTPSGQLLQATLLKALDLEMERATAAEKLRAITEASDRVRQGVERLASTPQVAVTPAEEETMRRDRDALMSDLDRVRAAFEVEPATFRIVSDARPPADPVRSTRKAIAGAVALLGVLLGFLVVLARELLDPTLKSGEEAALKLSLPVLGVLPRTRASDQDVLPAGSLAESFRMLAQRVRVAVPRRGARVMVASASDGEERGMVGAHLAAAFGRRDETVLLIDAQASAPAEDHGIRLLAGEAPEQRPGLGDILAGDAPGLGSAVRETPVQGVWLLPRGRATPGPEALGSRRMAELLDEASRRFSLVLLDVPPAISHVDADILAQRCDAVLLVVRSNSTRVPAIRTALERLGATGVPVIGAVLTGARPPYLPSAR